ncbi:hypothetical protein SNEBB_008043 [Seison nebaliae]|nr:hypothetical protein SNEBB_008043 [Seison nebaliae]
MDEIIIGGTVKNDTFNYNLTSTRNYLESTIDHRTNAWISLLLFITGNLIIVTHINMLNYTAYLKHVKPVFRLMNVYLAIFQMIFIHTSNMPHIINGFIFPIENKDFCRVLLYVDSVLIQLIIHSIILIMWDQVIPSFLERYRGRRRHNETNPFACVTITTLILIIFSLLTNSLLLFESNISDKSLQIENEWNWKLSNMMNYFTFPKEQIQIILIQLIVRYITPIIILSFLTIISLVTLIMERRQMPNDLLVYEHQNKKDNILAKNKRMISITKNKNHIMATTFLLAFSFIVFSAPDIVIHILISICSNRNLLWLCEYETILLAQKEIHIFFNLFIWMNFPIFWWTVRSYRDEFLQNFTIFLQFFKKH